MLLNYMYLMYLAFSARLDPATVRLSAGRWLVFKCRTAPELPLLTKLHTWYCTPSYVHEWGSGAASRCCEMMASIIQWNHGTRWSCWRLTVRIAPPSLRKAGILLRGGDHAHRSMPAVGSSCLCRRLDGLVQSVLAWHRDPATCGPQLLRT